MSQLPPSGSRAPYIIICNGRIELGTAANQFQKLRAASSCAAALVTYYGNRIGLADTLPISELQHEMMDLVNGNTMQRTRQQPKSADEMVDEMFVHLDALEKKMESRSY
jgi:hypothetical protein